MTTKQNELQQITDVITAQNISDIYLQNKSSSDKAIEFAQSLLKNKEITEQTYTALQNTLKKFRVTEKTLNERRKPITKMLDVLKKKFTELENKIGDNSEIVQQMKSVINEFARKQEDEKRKAQEELQKKIERESELNSLLPDFKESLMRFFMQKIDIIKNEHKRRLSTANKVDDLDKLYSDVQSLSVQPIFEIKKSDIKSKRYNHLTDEEYKIFIESVVIDDIISELNLSETFKKELDVFSVGFLPIISEKKRNIIDIEKQKELDKKKAEELAAKQKELDKKVLEDKEKSISEINKKLNQIEIEKQAAKFKAVASVQTDLFNQPAIKTQVKYDIIVKDNVGFSELYQLWFSHAGKDLDIESFKRITFERIINFCQKIAETDDVFIKSENIVYKEKIIGK